MSISRGLDPVWCRVAFGLRWGDKDQLIICAPVLKNSSVAPPTLAMASVAYRATSAAAPTHYGRAESKGDAVAWVKKVCSYILYNAHASLYLLDTGDPEHRCVGRSSRVRFPRDVCAGGQRSPVAAPALFAGVCSFVHIELCAPKFEFR